MKNKGFTLIELLAVIVILAIIALIAVPIILNIIGDAKKESSERSAELYLKAAELAIARKNLTTELGNTTCDVITTTTQSSYARSEVGDLACSNILVKVDMDGEKPTSGTVIFTNGKIADGTSIVFGTGTNAKTYSMTNGSLVLGEVSNTPTPTDESCFTYDDNENGVTITGYDSSCETDVVIPSTLDGKSVTEIGEEAFYEMSLTSVVIPNGVTTIGYSAFEENDLTSITIPNSVTTIDDNAFQVNQLTSVTIPSSVTEMGECVFAENQLTSVEILNNIIGWGEFSYNNFTSIVIPNNVTYIGSEAFANNQLTSVTIPNSVTYIGDRAFKNNRLTSVTIPESVTTIGDSAFGCSHIDSYGPNAIEKVTLVGKSLTSEFESYGENVFCWVSGKSDDNINE